MECGLVPVVTTEPGEVRRIVERDGAAVLAGWGTSADDAVAAAHAIFGAAVLRAPDPSLVRAGGERDRRLPMIDHTTPLEAHTDGFAYGDAYPDYFLLSCATASPHGGESFLGDGDDVVARRGAHPAGGELLRRLQTVPVDQTEPGMQPSCSPVIGRTREGRLMMRRFVHQRPAPDSDDPEIDAAMIGAWWDAIARASRTARRFKLRPGDVAVIDNYRMMHGREAYTDIERLMWRVWVWTTAAHRVPDGPLHSDSRYAALAAE